MGGAGPAGTGRGARSEGACPFGQPVCSRHGFRETACVYVGEEPRSGASTAAWQAESHPRPICQAGAGPACQQPGAWEGRTAGAALWGCRMVELCFPSRGRQAVPHAVPPHSGSLGGASPGGRSPERAEGREGLPSGQRPARKTRSSGPVQPHFPQEGTAERNRRDGVKGRPGRTVCAERVHRQGPGASRGRQGHRLVSRPRPWLPDVPAQTPEAAAAPLCEPLSPGSSQVPAAPSRVPPSSASRSHP